jgi:Leucine-rich repeat (LRR) protein
VKRRALIIAVLAMTASGCGEEEKSEGGADVSLPSLGDGSGTTGIQDGKATKGNEGAPSSSSADGKKAKDAEGEKPDGGTKKDASEEPKEAGSDATDGIGDASGAEELAEPLDPVSGVTCDADGACVVDGPFTKKVADYVKAELRGQLTLKGNHLDRALNRLRGLMGLVKKLIIRDNRKLTSLAPLSWLPRLGELELIELPALRSLDGVRGLAALRGLTIKNTGCVRFDALEKLVELRSLTLEYTRRACVPSMRPMESLKKLEHLAIHMQGVGDLRSVSKLKALKTLHLRAKVKSLEPIKALTNLKELTLFGVPAKDLRPLTKLNKLHTLRLIASPVWDARPLAKVRNLRTLQWHPGRARILAKLSGLRQVTSLTLPRAKPASWDVLRTMTWLKELNLDDSTFNDVRLLAPLTDLRSFSCARCRLRYVGQWPESSTLEWLNLHRTRGLPGGPGFLKKLSALKTLVVQRHKYPSFMLRSVRAANPELVIVHKPPRQSSQVSP